MTALTVILWFLAGVAVEVVNTFSRKWTVARLGQHLALGWVVGGYILRLAMTSAVLVLGFRHQAISGAAALMGYICSRWAMVLWLHRRVGREEDREGPSP